MHAWEGIVVHWSASGPHTTVSQLRSWHKSRGWRDIGYHRVIVHPILYAKRHKIEDLMPGDLIKLGRKLDDNLTVEWQEYGAHAQGRNRTHIGVCVVAGPHSPVHPLQLEALNLTLDIFTERYKLSPGSVCGHRDVNQTECPGHNIYRHVNSWKEAQKFG